MAGWVAYYTFSLKGAGMRKGEKALRRLPVAAVALMLILSAVVCISYAQENGGPEGPVYLYFADPETGYLTGEPRKIERTEDDAAYYAEIVKALISGPENDLVPVLPDETRVLVLYAGPDDTVFVDLSADAKEHHPGGVRSELLSVYSIVNTLALNCDGIRAVKIMIEGNETETMAGHVDITRPLKAQMLLVR